MDLIAVSYALVSIIVFTLLYEYSTEHLEEFLEETPYIKIVQQVYKELTVMGLISFLIFMLNQAGTLLSENPVAFLAFEYAHMLIFFIALMIIITALYLCLINVIYREQYLKTDMQQIEELLANHGEMTKFQQFCYDRWWIPSNLRQDFEFKLMHSFFIDAYMVPPSFEFGLYLCESLDLQIVELVEVDMTSWMTMIAAVILNLVRVEISKAFFNSDYYEEDVAVEDVDVDEPGAELVGGRLLHTDFVHRLLGTVEVAVDCDISNSTNGTSRLLGAAAADPFPCDYEPRTDTVWTFIIFGFFLSGCSFLLWHQARLSFMRLLAKSGCNCIEDYFTRLDVLNKTFNPRFNEAKMFLKKRLSTTNKLVQRQNPGARRRQDGTMIQSKVRGAIDLENPDGNSHSEIANQATHLHPIPLTPNIHAKPLANHHHMDFKDLKRIVHAGAAMGHGGHGHGHGSHGHSPKPPAHDSSKRGSKPSLLEGVDLNPQRTMGDFKNLIKSVKVAEMEAEERAKSPVLKDGKLVLQHHHHSERSVHKKHSHPSPHVSPKPEERASPVDAAMGPVGGESVLSIDLHDIYLFGKANIFNKAVDVLLLAFCTYIAMLATNFGFLAADMENTGLMVLLMLFPAAISIFPLTATILYMCQLRSISVLDIECVAKILEEHDEADKLKDEIVQKFVTQMEYQGLKGTAGLQTLFDKVDRDHSGTIDQHEFKELLNQQQIFFTKRMFVMLFHVFDTDNSHTISIDELGAVCFPQMAASGVHSSSNLPPTDDPNETTM